MQGYYIDNSGPSTAYAPQGLFGVIGGQLLGEAIGKKLGHRRLGGAVGGLLGGFAPLQAPVAGPAPVAFAPSAPAGYAPMAVPVGPAAPFAAPVAQADYQPLWLGSALKSIAAPVAKAVAKEAAKRAAPYIKRGARYLGRKLVRMQAHPYAPVQYAEIDVEIDEEGNEIAPMGFAPQFAAAPAFEPQSLQPMGVAYPDGEIVPMAGPIGEAVARWAPIIGDGVQLIGEIAQYIPYSVEPGYPPVQQVPVQPGSPATAPVYGAPAYA